MIQRLWIVLSVVAAIKWLGISEGIDDAWLYVCAIGVWAVWMSHAPASPEDEGPYSSASLFGQGEDRTGEDSRPRKVSR